MCYEAKDKQPKNNSYIWLTFALIMVGIIVLWYNFPTILVDHLSPNLADKNLSSKGQFGDTYGVLNTLFSGLAFAGLICAILLQRQELIDTREVLQGQKDELNIQNENLKIQRFENTFFKMLELHNSLVNSMRIGIGEQDYLGRQALTRIFRDMEEEYKFCKAREPSDDMMARTYKKIYSEYNRILGHYMRNLFRLFKFIDENPLIVEHEGKAFYSDIVRAQLSNQELAFLFYNCTLLKEGENFKEYVIRYELLDNFDMSYLLDPAHENLIDAQAFGNKQKLGEFSETAVVSE